MMTGRLYIGLIGEDDFLHLLCSRELYFYTLAP